MRDPEEGPAEAVTGEDTVDDDPGDRVLVRQMLRLTPDERLQGLTVAAAFFGSARRV